MLKKEEILEDLERSGALLKGHFLLSSGLHSDQYVQCASLLKYPQLAGKLCIDLARKLTSFQAEIVIGPALGGIIVAYELARVLNIPGIFAERKDGEMLLRRNFQIAPGQRVLVAEDVITTGGSVREVIKIVEDQGGKLVGVTALIDRSKGEVDFGVPYASLISLDFKLYQADNCPLCIEGGEAVKPGSRKL